jgi:hypothetical protein
VKEDEMGRECRMQKTDDQSIEGFDGKARRKETTKKT